MEKTYNPALIQRTQRYMETHSISQNQFAAKVNLSSAALSSYLNQKYKGSVEAVERQLSEFFKLDEEAEAAAEKTASLLPRAAYVPTSISEDVCQSIRFSQLEHCMVVLHGDAGVGKSKGAQKFLRDHPTNAVGISITPSTGTLNGSIKLLARALRVPECRNKMDQMMAMRSRLDGTNWVIVIDEAQHLKYAALEEIRSLTDDNPMTGEHGVGVVLIGNSEVYSRLQGRQQAQFAQLFSRIRMQREYTTRKVKEDDVRKLFPVLAEQNARKELDFLLSVCRSPWGMSDGSPQARYFDKTIDAVGNVCCPLHSLILYIRPWDGVQTVTQLLADQLPDLVPVALLYGIHNAVKEWILRRKVEVRGNAVCSTTAPAAAIVGLLVQHVQFVKGGQFTISVLDLLRCAARRRSDAVHSLGCSGAGGDCAPGKERHQPRNVTEHHRRRICQRSQRGGKYLNDGRGCRGRCALQVAERRPQAGRRQQRRPHPAADT